jgi:GNAT superfamily N-acetyltransferase
MPLLSEATNADIPQLCGLLGILFSQEAEFAPDSALQERGLQMIIGNAEVGKILVLRDGEKVIGMANLLFSVSTALGARVAVLEDVVVRTDCRGKGFGTMLLKGAIVRAKKYGCARITLLTDSDNLRGQKFYMESGFKYSAMIPMRLMLNVTTDRNW